MNNNSDRPEIMISPREFAWASNASPSVGTSLNREVETTVLKGDPSGPGLYTLLLRIAPNTRIQPHSHQDDRIATVVSGTWYFAYGDEFDESVLKALPPGSFYTEPPGVNHFGLTKDEVLIQMTGIGPSSTTYVNSQHDPTGSGEP
jgi:quercetin dioxygenase-like cupin family protein